MVTHNRVCTPLSESSQCIKICIWFPRLVFNHMVLFSALQSSSRLIQTQNLVNWVIFGNALLSLYIPLRLKVRYVLGFVFGFHAMCFNIWSCFPRCIL